MINLLGKHYAKNQKEAIRLLKEQGEKRIKTRKHTSRGYRSVKVWIEEAAA